LPETGRLARKVPFVERTVTLRGRSPVNAVTVTCSPGRKLVPRTTSGELDSIVSAGGDAWAALPELVAVVEPTENSSARSASNRIVTPGG
jgi:hypothetical protein